MGRSPCCSKVGLRRGPWSSKEDALLTNYIHQHGEGQWRSLPKKAGLLRCGKSCRLRWMNYLRPGIKRGNISEDEEDLIVRLHKLLGNRWSLIAGRLPGRTDNEIKNYWNTHLLKKLTSAGLHPPVDTSSKDAAAPPPPPPQPEKKTTKKHKIKAAKRKEQKKPVQEKNQEDSDSAPKFKVYMPKAMRVSASFFKADSYETLGGSRTSSSDGGGEAAEKPESNIPSFSWSPFFEMEDFPFDDGFLDVLAPPIHHHHDSFAGDVDVNVLDIFSHPL